MSSPLGAALPHASALAHVSGAANYIDDLPVPPGLLHAMIVPSAHAHARLLRKDAGAALRVPGVWAVIFAEDLPAANNVGPVVHDEPLLATDAVYCVGQPLALVVADSLDACRAAVAVVQIDYDPLPAHVTLDAAVAAEDFHGAPHVIARGDLARAMAEAPHRLQGTHRSGAQEHFYLETQCALAILDDEHSVRVFSSTQHPSETQLLVAETLGWGRHRVTVVCPRMGGAFGGKETQANNIGCFAALGAVRSGRPCKLWLDRDTDMQLTGRRHPFRVDWQVGFGDDGRIAALRADLISDAGWAMDLSLSILDRAMFHVDNAYWLPVVRISGRAARTHKTSNTAFRGFGGPQGMVVIEQIMERIARVTGLDPLEVRRRNLYRPGAMRAPYGQRVDDFRLPRILDQLEASSELQARRAAVDDFNQQAGRWRRGIALTPVKFGISFTAAFLNQAGAYVVLYADGTVQLNHGGTEMGQGLYTKMIQVCAHALGVSPRAVRAMPTATDKVPNTSATAASSGADLNGAAVQLACEELVRRLHPVAMALLDAEVIQLAAGSRAARPEVEGEPAWAWVAGGAAVSLAQVAKAAYLERVSMAATGFYRTPDIEYDRQAGQGKPFHYFAYGAAVSEVELDGLSGQWRLLRTDILQDVGDALSPDIDRGQIEGGFVQGLGWVTMEELVFADDGRLLTHAPSTYKIPTLGDVPADLRVALLDRATQPGVVYGSKAVGEPPFMLAISVHAALQRAVWAFGSEADLPLPASHEALLAAIEGG